MFNQVQISNFALAHLGDEARVVSIDPPDQSVQANYCALFYDLALVTVLSEHTWSFATKVKNLALLVNDDPRWLYCYAMPADQLRVFNIFPFDQSSYYPTDSNQIEFVKQLHSSGVSAIYTNQESASCQYVLKVSDSHLFSSLFDNALSWALAINLAGVILKGDTGVAAAQSLTNGYAAALRKAVEDDCRNRHVRYNHVPAGIKARA